MAKLEQKTVDEGCEAAYQRYKAMPGREASLAFSYELQAFVKLLLFDQDYTFAQAVVKVMELFVLLEKANRP